MDEIINNENALYLLVTMGLVVLLLSIHFYRKKKTIDFAKWIAKEGQYKPLPKSHLDEAIRDAERKGFDDIFLILLRLVRENYGHDGVKIGHLYWIWDQIKSETPINEIKDIPSFISESK